MIQLEARAARIVPSDGDEEIDTDIVDFTTKISILFIIQIYFRHFEGIEKDSLSMIQILKISDFLLYQGKNTENTEQNQAFIADLSLTGANVIELSFLPDCSLKRYKKIATSFLMYLRILYGLCKIIHRKLPYNDEGKN